MSAGWRQDKVQDHKFDFIDVEDYIDESGWRKFKYTLVFAIVIKGILIYCADLWTVVNLFFAKDWVSTSSVNGKDLKMGEFNISFEYYRYIFAACIFLSFILLAWDIKKAVAVVESRDISYAFTSMIAYRYYAIKSYPHFCLFEKIHNSKKTIDEVAFFCFFTFRGWKRLLFADGPRQMVNAAILYNTVQTQHFKYDIRMWMYVKGEMAQITLCLMTFTLTLWVISVLLMFAAVCLYIPLVIEIKGNLKEFCCHKIDKRIDEIVKKKAKERAQEASKNGKNEGPTQKPTLPNIGLIEEGPMPGGTPRMGAQQHHMGSPAIRKAAPPPNDPYRRQQPPRPYSPGPRSQTPTMDDDTDTRPLRHDNHAQHYHNRNMRRDQQYDFEDNRSEVSDGYSAGGGYPYSQYPPKPQLQAHRRQGSDTSTVLSGSNQGSVVSGYGPSRPTKPHPLHNAHSGNMYGGDAMMMTDMSGAYRGAPTGLGGGVHPNPNGSVMGGGGPGYVNQQRGHHQQGPPQRPYN